MVGDHIPGLASRSRGQPHIFFLILIVLLVVLDSPDPYSPIILTSARFRRRPSNSP